MVVHNCGGDGCVAIQQAATLRSFFFQYIVVTSDGSLRVAKSASAMGPAPAQLAAA